MDKALQDVKTSVASTPTPYYKNICTKELFREFFMVTLKP